MAEHRVHQWIEAEQSGLSVEWEEESYRQGCARARKLAEQSLESLDDELMRSRPKGLRLVGSRARTLITRFGDVVISRRMYRDSEGEVVFALDEYLGWKPQQQVSVSVSERVLEMVAHMPFRTVCKTVSELTAGVLSPMTVHRLVRDVGQKAVDEDIERCEAQFERGEDMSEGRQRADILYTEADGVWIHLQREERKRYELKSAIAYGGWRSVGNDRYELVDKRVYCHGSDRMSFWEGASLEWAKQYDLCRVKLLVVGGDGANWIRSGVDELGESVFQLDGFHLSRACSRGYGKQLGRAIYEAIRAADTSSAQTMMRMAEAAETKTAVRDRRYVESNVNVGMDWRNRVRGVPSDARALGTMESNGDKLTANRMKKRGMSWTIDGANRMAKVIQLSRNGELERFCVRGRADETRKEKMRPSASKRPASGGPVSDWTQASVPALSGPHSSRPWTHGLRRLLHTAY